MLVTFLAWYPVVTFKLVTNIRYYPQPVFIWIFHEITLFLAVVGMCRRAYRLLWPDWSRDTSLPVGFYWSWSTTFSRITEEANCQFHSSDENSIITWIWRKAFYVLGNLNFQLYRAICTGNPAKVMNQRSTNANVRYDLVSCCKGGSTLDCW